MNLTKVLTDSINPDGQRITTFLAKYPRYIHAEIMTHRALSRNAASSRAIPIEKMMRDVRENPAIPVRWGKNQSGMQSFEVLGPDEAEVALGIWRATLGHAMVGCEMLFKQEVHKQWANRVIEPWMHITVLITATELGNFFNLRAHPDVMPDFQELAYRMLWRYKNSAPEQKQWGEWHIPFGEQMPDLVPNSITRDMRAPNVEEMIKIATARAARLSYLTFEGEFAPVKDFGLHDRLEGSGHWSPFEHCAVAEPIKPQEWGEMIQIAENLRGWDREQAFEKLKALEPHVKRDQGNFRGWTPYRKKFPTENRSEMDVDALLARKPDWIELEHEYV